MAAAPPSTASAPPAQVQNRPRSVEAAKRADWVAFLFRAPYALDAYELGFTVGLREDYGFQDDSYASLEMPVEMLDNNFRRPDLERYVEVLSDAQPQVGVIGDAYDASEAAEFVGAARTLQQEFPAFEPVIVPKSLGALEAIPKDLVVGYPIGYSEIGAEDFSRPGDWRGRRIHILGGTPPTQWEAIQALTNSGEADTTLSAFGVERRPWADIVGLDWNGLYKIALKGQYWHHESPHWRCADDLTIRATVRKGLGHVRQFWRERGVWPTSTGHPADDRTPARRAPPAPGVGICHGCGHDLADGGRLGDADSTTEPLVVEYEDGTILQYCSERCRDRVEYRDGPIPLSHGQCRGAKLGGYHQERRRADWFEAQ